MNHSNSSIIEKCWSCWIKHNYVTMLIKYKSCQ